MIKFYSNNCPRCKVLKMLMDKNNIEYNEFDDPNLYMSVAKDNGIMSMPFAEIDGVLYDSKDLQMYIKERTK